MLLPYELRGDDGSRPAPEGPAVSAITALCIGVFVLQLLGGEAAIVAWGFLPGSGNSIGILTHMFMHGGLGHLIGNLVFLHAFGRRLEQALGSLGFLGLYLVSGLVAATVHAWAEGLPMLSRVAPADELVASGVKVVVGASGAISGVMGAVLVHWPTSPVAVLWFLPPVSFGTTLLLPAWLVILVGFAGDLAEILAGSETGVAHWAHLGGAMGGMVLAQAAFRAEVGVPPEPILPVEAVFSRAWRLYLHGRPIDALRELRTLEGRPLPPELRTAIRELEWRIQDRLVRGGSW